MTTVSEPVEPPLVPPEVDPPLVEVEPPLVEVGRPLVEVDPLVLVEEPLVEVDPPELEPEEVPEDTVASQQDVYGASPLLKIQYHWKVYSPALMSFGILKQPVQSDLSIFSQNLVQFWNPLKSMTPLVCPPKSATTFCLNADCEGSLAPV